MNILIIGAEGSMGRRYQAIVKYFNHDLINRDKHNIEKSLQYDMKRSDAVIIATPTDTHIELIKELLSYKKPILCEKPLTKNMDELNQLEHAIRESKTPFRMMYQYQELVTSTNKKGLSWYNYFRHGSDGLVWDCMQIIGLSNGSVNLAEDSPFWDCSINNQRLDFARMDTAYVDYFMKWLRIPSQDFNEILDAHIKTDEIARSGRF